MAVSYREYMMDKFPELTRQTESDVPVAVEIIGAVDEQSTTLVFLYETI